ncbi:glycosyltransferase family 4 protein [Ruoffia sp. FAM 24228]|uniref:glycosyltransferase family 4 protein n=1 Tax=Ruoffia sp. FAM 24228 TaxID=3259517 RepID=UPI0038897F05
MKKMLMLASVASMIDQFNMNNIDILQQLGVEVHVAANFVQGNSTSKTKIDTFKAKLRELNIPSFQIDFTRNMFLAHQHIQAYLQLYKLAKKEKYDFIHCHSPIGGVIGRLVGRHLNIPVIYTAHGFHFYKNSSKLSWVIYYPIERFLSRYTHTLVTINQEDYERASGFSAENCAYIPGIGIDLDEFKKQPEKNQAVREEFLNSPDEDFLILSVGELNKNKNHQVVIKALSLINNPKIHYVLCGQGDLKDELEAQAIDAGLQDNVKFLGFREDIQDIYSVADLFVFPSYREGLPVSLMEAMASGLPVVCSNIRGNVDLINDHQGGFLVDPSDEVSLKDAIIRLYNDSELRKQQTNYNDSLIGNFSIDTVALKMKEIYKGLV